MKKLLLALLLIPIIGTAQLNVDVGTGYSFDSKHVPVALEVSYEKWNVVLASEMQIDATRDAAKNNYFGGKIGYDIHSNALLSIIPYVGYYFDFVSEDNTKLNGWYFGGSLRATMWGGDKVNYYLDATYIQGVQITMGVIIKL